MCISTRKSYPPVHSSNLSGWGNLTHQAHSIEVTIVHCLKFSGSGCCLPHIIAFANTEILHFKLESCVGSEGPLLLGVDQTKPLSDGGPNPGWQRACQRWRQGWLWLSSLSASLWKCRKQQAGWGWPGELLGGDGKQEIWIFTEAQNFISWSWMIVLTLVYSHFRNYAPPSFLP